MLADLGLSDGAPELKIKVALRKRLDELFGDAGKEPFAYLARLLGLSLEPESRDHLESLEAEKLKHETRMALRDYFMQLTGSNRARPGGSTLG